MMSLELSSIPLIANTHRRVRMCVLSVTPLALLQGSVCLSEIIWKRSLDQERSEVLIFMLDVFLFAVAAQKPI